MKYVFERHDCQLRTAAGCTGTFDRPVLPGRVPKGCPECATVKSAPSGVRQCGCGQEFSVAPGSGNKSRKCDTCKEAGLTYRRDDSGELQVLTADQIQREQDERKAQLGRDRAERLFHMMQPLLKSTKERTVIEH